MATSAGDCYVILGSVLHVYSRVEAIHDCTGKFQHMFSVKPH